MCPVFAYNNYVADKDALIYINGSINLPANHNFGFGTPDLI